MRFRLFNFKASSLLIWVAAVLSAGFVGAALHDLWGYFRLEERSPAYVYQWKVVQISPSEFGIKYSFTFKARGKTYKGKNLFSKPYHFNRESAEKQVQAYASRPWMVWYQPSRPQISSLERNFPAKRCLYALMTLGVFFYFLQLNSRILQKSVK